MKKIRKFDHYDQEFFSKKEDRLAFWRKEQKITRKEAGCMYRDTDGIWTCKQRIPFV